MAILLSCKNISKTYGARPLFENLSFGLFEGEHAGLIGPNGVGKSTLLKILAGVEKTDDGEISMRRGLRVGYLAQQDHFEKGKEGVTVHQELVHALHGLHLEDYEIDMRVEAGIEHAGFSSGDQEVNKLSGGWRKRLSILAQVIREPDLLLLDEPTNHLDLEGVLWLEKFISEQEFSFLMITHDRRFLERVTNRVIELNKRYAEGHFSSAGNYSQFLENREKLFDAQAAKEDTMQNIVKREIEWLRRGPKARTTKQKARIDRAGNLIKELGELKYRNTQGRPADIDFTGSDRKTKKLVEAIKVEKSLGGRKLFGPLNLVLSPGDKLGLLGGNGSGKSTLLKILSGKMHPDTGTLNQAEHLKVVVFDQHREQLDLSMPLRKALCESGQHVHYQGRPIHVYSWADRFLFGKEQLDLPLGRLSGGEQARVLISRLMLKEADVLLLDEPTNDLDIHSLEVLETSMMDFPGALVLVTHDRYLLDRVSREILSLDGKGNARFFADLSQWEDWLENQEEYEKQEAEESSSEVKPSASKESKPALSTNEQKELKNMEATIKSAEEQLDKARQFLEDPAVAADAVELQKRHEKVDEARAKVDALFDRWEDLQARQ